DRRAGGSGRTGGTSEAGQARRTNGARGASETGGADRTSCADGPCGAGRARQTEGASGTSCSGGSGRADGALLCEECPRGAVRGGIVGIASGEADISRSVERDRIAGGVGSRAAPITVERD